jgi:hypothetical protein
LPGAAGCIGTEDGPLTPAGVAFAELAGADLPGIFAMPVGSEGEKYQKEPKATTRKPTHPASDAYIVSLFITYSDNTTVPLP